MKLFLLPVFLLTVFTISSCKKDNNTPIERKTLKVTLLVNEDYEYDLGEFGDEEGAVIEKQPSNFTISEMKRIDAVQMVYYYKPKLNFQGSDEVTLKSEWGSDGASLSTRFLYTTIKFVIKE